MKILNFAKIMLLCVMTMGLASCGDDNYYTTIENSMRNSAGKLGLRNMKPKTELVLISYNLRIKII